MKKLPVRVTKNKHVYTQVLRSQTKAIYEQHTKDGILVGHEVFSITYLPDRVVFFKNYLAGEKYPSAEDFGRTAWSSGPNPQSALKKYNSLK